MAYRASECDRLSSRILHARAGGRVERYHTVPHSPYNVAAHSWGAAVMLYQLWPENFYRLAIHMLIHDVPECLTGDIPAPVKRHFPQIQGALEPLEDQLLNMLQLPDDHGLNDRDKLKLKTCDLFEFYLWCREESQRGNTFVLSGLHEIMSYIEDLRPLLEPAEKVYCSWKSAPSIMLDIRAVMSEALQLNDPNCENASHDNDQ